MRQRRKAATRTRAWSARHIIGRVTGLATLVLATLVAAPAPAESDANALVPRVPPSKPAYTLIEPSDDPRTIIVKFSEGANVRLRSDPAPSLTLPPHDAGTLQGILQKYSIESDAIQRLFTRPEEELDAEREAAQLKSGRALADLNLYYRITLPAGVDAGRLCDELNALPFVELSSPAPRPAPLPRDIPPPTPDFTGQQGYLGAGSGIGAVEVMSTRGADGSGISVVDMEYSWVLDHEDLELPSSANIDTATLVDPFPDGEGSHGTAVLGVLGAKRNGYGVTGIVPGASLRVVPQNTREHGYNSARAISLATGVSSPGDVILLEAQTCVCNRHCPGGDSHSGYGPIEWWQPVYDASALATALGITIVATAGNGDVNLDSSGCQRRFDRTYRDSGAIIVGAGSSRDHSKRPLSSHGSRVDLQGWGQNVTTTGYGSLRSGSLFDPGDRRQRYTRSFGGTSGAAPIVAGAVASIQGIVKAAGRPPLSPAQVRSLLVRTGTPQGNPRRENIGPLPNLPAAVKELGLGGEGSPITLPLVTPASNTRQQGFVRIINHSNHAGTVNIHAIDDSGQRFGPVFLSLRANSAMQFNSRDLERGNFNVGLSGGVGNGSGDWRLELRTTLNIEPFAYIRTPDGFLTSMHDLVRTPDDLVTVQIVDREVGTCHRVPLFNPGSNRSLVSRLRLINPGQGDADITIRGVDARGRPPPRGDVRLTLRAGAARTLTAQQLEGGGPGLSGRFGDGAGKWQLLVFSSAPLQVMNLMQTRSGHLTNLSTSPVPVSAEEYCL